MRKAPHSASAGALLEPIFRFGPTRKMTTVVYSGHIWLSRRAVFLTFLGSLFDMASKSAQRVPQGLKKEVLAGDVEGQGGIPKVPPLYEEGPPQRRRRSSSGSTRAIRAHAKNEDSCTVWTLFGPLKRDFFDLFGVCI